MKTAEQIADNVIRNAGKNVGARPLIIAALKEYGELVRQRAAGVINVVGRDWEADDQRIKKYACDYLVAAVERMELP